MKKIVFACGAAALMLGASACSQKSAKADDSFTDSITVFMGKVQGASLAQRLAMDVSAPEMSKESFIRGLNTAVMADTADMGYLQGLSMGVRMAQQFQAMYQQADLDIDRGEFMAEFKKAFMADSFPSLALDETILTNLMQKAQERAQQKQREALENSPEAIAGREAGEKFLAEQMAKDSSIKKTDSGLGYKVITEGTGAKITDDDQVEVKYRGTFADGTEFDSSKDATAKFSPRRVVPGFSEGLKLMNKGSKYVLYVPGNLGYGPEGQPYAKIGPNQMLVFEVEVVDVESPETK